MGDTRNDVDPKCELYQWGTWEPTDRLVELRGGAAPTKREIRILWDVYVDGAANAGVPATIEEFGLWLIGYNEEGLEGATVFW